MGKKAMRLRAENATLDLLLRKALEVSADETGATTVTLISRRMWELSSVRATLERLSAENRDLQRDLAAISEQMRSELVAMKVYPKPGLDNLRKLHAFVFDTERGQQTKCREVLEAADHESALVAAERVARERNELRGERAALALEVSRMTGAMAAERLEHDAKLREVDTAGSQAVGRAFSLAAEVCEGRNRPDEAQAIRDYAEEIGHRVAKRAEGTRG